MGRAFQHPEVTLSLLLLAAPLSLLIGISLGLLGGGGSILTVPLLVYVLGVGEKSAIAASLFVVGVTSAVAATAHARSGNVVWRTSLLFAAGGMSGAFVGGRLAHFVPGGWLLAIFAVIMVLAASFMWRGRPTSTSPPTPTPPPVLFALGLAIGSVTGLVGAGGGFLIVPALALAGGLPMPQAIASSLVVIALQSFAGFAGQIGHVDVPWTLTLVVTGAAILGMLILTAAALLAAFILVKQLPAVLS